MRLLSVCDSEHDAAASLGYTKVSWDNLSGKEQQPFSSIKFWASLTDTEKAAAALLGYTETTWESGQRPAARFKNWADLNACGDG